MTRRHEGIETRRKRRGAVISCAVVTLLAGTALAGCSSTVDGKATFSADGSGRGGGPGLTVPTATSPNGPSPDAPSSAGSASSSAAPSPTASPTPKPKPKPKPKLKAKIHGWQPVGHQVRRIAYDAPPNWKVASADTIIGFENAAGPEVSMSAASLYRDDFCKPGDGSSRAGAGVAASRGPHLAATAHDAARDWAKAAYEDGAKHATMKIGKPKSLRIPGVHAVEVVANVTVPKPGKCGAPRGMVQAVAVSGGRSAGIFIVYADLNVKSAAPTKVLNEMVSSVRRIP